MRHVCLTLTLEVSCLLHALTALPQKKKYGICLHFCIRITIAIPLTREMSSWGWTILLDAPVVFISATFWGVSLLEVTGVELWLLMELVALKREKNTYIMRFKNSSFITQIVNFHTLSQYINFTTVLTYCPLPKISTLENRVHVRQAEFLCRFEVAM